uniref:thiopurine S-methyltransferase n=1 Tax=Sphenodon punctatus TaxID=8508 RepID=A0A8D0GXW1_SPHPU
MDSSVAASAIKELSPEPQKGRVVAKEEWLRKWEAGNIGFHKKERHLLLEKYLDALLNSKSRLKILFPLCGKAVEMKWLADMGHKVVGVELSERALKEFFTEQNLSYSEESVPEISGAKVFKSTSGNISLYCCSILEFSSMVAGKFDGIWDRGSLVAINPCDRECYANLMLSLMERDSCCLLVTVVYDPSKIKGPPFYVPDSEVKSLFGGLCDIKCLEKRDDFSDLQKLWGLDYFFEVIYLLKLKASAC